LQCVAVCCSVLQCTICGSLVMDIRVVFMDMCNSFHGN